MKNNLILACIALTAFIVAHVHAIDNYHFYRASYFFGEPRLEKRDLTTVEIDLAGGSATKGIDFADNSVPIFDIYGPHNMRVLGNGVPNKNPSNPADLALINLAMEPNAACFAKLSFPGTFSLIEADFNFIQNFKKGFFGQLYVPVRRIKSQPCAFVDLSPITCCCPNKFTPAWQDFLNRFDEILAQYNLCFAGTNAIGFGDVSLLLGWTNNYQETEVLDYIDVTVKGGLLFPTGKPKNENLIFSIPFGYDKHFGFPILLDFSFGVYEWLTFGFHGQALVFLNRCKEARIKTDFNQNGLIKLAKTRVNSEEGAIWALGAYTKADHLGPGLSFLLGYTYATQEKTIYCDAECPPSPIFNPEIVNSDEMLQGWNMSTIHFLFEYDFTKEGMRVGPRLGFLLNAVVGGRRIFKTNMIGAYLGIDIAWP